MIVKCEEKGDDVVGGVCGGVCGDFFGGMG